MVILILISIAAVLLLITLWSTFTLRTTRLEIKLKNLPDEFDGCKLVQISDLHNASFGKANSRLIRRIKECNPDYILMTGDFAGGKSFDHPEKGSFHKLAQGLSPDKVYISLGNHELRLEYKHPDWLQKQYDDISSLGGILLDNSSIRLERNGAHINLFGLSIHGVRHSGAKSFCIPKGIFEGTLKPIENETNILMAHIPQFFDEYAKAGYDLVLSGHIHGGIVRLPLIGGVFSPERSFFPKLCYGIYNLNKTVMFITAGLGRALIPLRFFCRPEVAEIVLKKNE